MAGNPGREAPGGRGGTVPERGLGPPSFGGGPALRGIRGGEDALAQEGQRVGEQPGDVHL
jgi:hypothetical protein